LIISSIIFLIAIIITSFLFYRVGYSNGRESVFKYFHNKKPKNPTSMPGGILDCYHRPPNSNCAEHCLEDCKYFNVYNN